MCVLKRYLIPIAALATALSWQIEAADQYDLDEEINRIRRELNQVQAERQRVKEETVNDRKEFAEYVDRMRKRFETIKDETDSIRADIRTQQSKVDSLSALVNSTVAAQKQYELLQDNTRNKLMSGCSKMIGIANTFPPMASKTLTASLSYLQSELNSKAIDNVEGVNRLSQVIKDMTALTTSIQIQQGTPPVTSITGTAYRIRIGALFEAAANSKGTKAAVWDGYDDSGNPLWRLIDDPAVAANILLAVNIREGKKLPAFVKLPFNNVENMATQAARAAAPSEGEAE
ncbi:MAG: DUF3450 family protein [Chitinivibrionales bacterium]|nr:DUF3450 family protein [Chitinivibrionales bacterium]